MIFDKNGKAYFPCLGSNKERPAKPEEIIRQLWLHRLIHHYGYPASRIAIEHPINFGREIKRADIVVFDEDRLTTPYMVVEVKKTKLKDGKEQLKSYCNAGRRRPRRHQKTR